MYSPKTLGYSACVNWPLRLDNSRMTRCTLDINSYKDIELVNIKTAIGHVRPGLQGFELRFNSAVVRPIKALGF